MVKLIVGSFMFVAGLFFLATGVGAIIGIPMFIGGLPQPTIDTRDRPVQSVPQGWRGTSAPVPQAMTLPWLGAGRALAVPSWAC